LPTPTGGCWRPAADASSPRSSSSLTP
jgi:hypothetical protein